MGDSNTVVASNPLKHNEQEPIDNDVEFDSDEYDNVDAGELGDDTKDNELDAVTENIIGMGLEGNQILESYVVCSSAAALAFGFCVVTACGCRGVLFQTFSLLVSLL
ncbi:hypothetical protein M5K25_024717 [Dendrobium thyrsiflorum]|uniref:Uncharacterized protein n=1 Tax=Dendrobium thyrsiflorum TaxID=117978 RepID=A0ABD0U2Y7_DENTH